MDMAVLSLILFCATLVVAVLFKINTGLVAIVVSLVLCWITGTPEKFLLSSFDSKMFLMLFGVMYLFSIAQENKTLELLSKKVFALCRGNAKLLPIVVFLVSAVIAAIGGGAASGGGRSAKAHQLRPPRAGMRGAVIWRQF